MREIHTQIVIQAKPKDVWTTLTDFQAYKAWNPFIKAIEGTIEIGSKFDVFIQPPDSKQMHFRPVCKVLSAPHELRWLGSLIFPGLFDGEHIFEIRDLGNGSSEFVQRERFRGVLVPLFWASMHKKTKAGFEEMNEALKTRVESNNSQVGPQY